MVARPLSPPSDLALNPMAGATFAQSTALPCHVTPAGRRITKEMLRQRSPGRGNKRVTFNQQLTASRPRASKQSASAAPSLRQARLLELKHQVPTVSAGSLAW
jgi:hypothetical protein